MFIILNRLLILQKDEYRLEMRNQRAKAHDTDVNCVRFLGLMKDGFKLGSCDDSGVFKIWFCKP